MKVAISTPKCAREGTSEAYVGYNWYALASSFTDATLITADPEINANDAPDVHKIKPFPIKLKSLAPRFFGAAKPDYFFFDRQSKRTFKSRIKEFDVFHHVTPIGPRYSSSLGCLARRFVLGPVGGGLRVPIGLREDVETDEPFYFKLRNLDRVRFTLDRSLIKTYESADKILVVADYMREIIPERFHHKLDVLLETAVHTEAYSDKTWHRAPASNLRLLYVGRVVPYKGLKYLIKALSQLPRDARKSLQLSVVGENSTSYGALCKSLVEKFKLEKQVSFLGPLPKAAVQKLYTKADIFCFPSLAETSGNALLEAMASGLPAISIDHGGPSTIVSRGTGILCNPSSPNELVDQLAEAISQLAGATDRTNMGRAARKRILKEFSWSSKRYELRKVYDAVAT